jgi:hypothetical protein
MSNIHIILDNNDSVIEVFDLKNELTGVFLNAATVTVTLKDSVGVNVAGDSWPKTLTYEAGSNGIYRATLLYSLGLTAGSRYTATVTADAGAGLRAEWNLECVCRVRN